MRGFDSDDEKNNIQGVLEISDNEDLPEEEVAMRKMRKKNIKENVGLAKTNHVTSIKNEVRENYGVAEEELEEMKELGLSKTDKELGKEFKKLRNTVPHRD